MAGAAFLHARHGFLDESALRGGHLRPCRVVEVLVRIHARMDLVYLRVAPFLQRLPEFVGGGFGDLRGDLLPALTLWIELSLGLLSRIALGSIGVIVIVCRDAQEQGDTVPTRVGESGAICLRAVIAHEKRDAIA